MGEKKVLWEWINKCKKQNVTNERGPGRWLRSVRTRVLVHSACVNGQQMRWPAYNPISWGGEVGVSGKNCLARLDKLVSTAWLKWETVPIWAVKEDSWQELLGVPRSSFVCLFIFITLIYLFSYVFHARYPSVWRSDMGAGFLLPPSGPWDGPRVIRLGSRCLSLLSHVPSWLCSNVHTTKWSIKFSGVLIKLPRVLKNKTKQNKKFYYLYRTRRVLK